MMARKNGCNIRGWLAAMVCCLMVQSGCGGSSVPADRPQVARVSGVVTHKGAPVPNAYVSFFPEGKGEAGAAMTDKEGRFTVSTYKRLDGAVVGLHTVTVQIFPTEPGAERELRKQSPIPAIYFKKETSPFKLEVKPKTTNDFTLNLDG